MVVMSWQTLIQTTLRLVMRDTVEVQLVHFSVTVMVQEIAHHPNAQVCTAHSSIYLY